MDNPYPVCENCIFVDEPLDKDPCQECIRAFLAQRIKPNFVSKRKPQTNADRIRSMTDEELAEFLKEQTSLAHNYGYECADGEPDFPDGIPADYNYLTWLRKEVTDG